MDRIRNNSVLCFLVALLLIIGMMPMTGTAFAAGEPPQVDDSLVGQDITRISVTADLHLLGNGGQNNRDRFEAYLKGIQDFGPELLIVCGDQFEEAYAPPAEGDYSSEAGIGLDFTNPYNEIRAIAAYYLGDVPIVFVRGNNDYNTGNDYDTYAGFGTDHFGLVKTDYVDVFRFGVENSGSFNFSTGEIAALDSYLAGRDDKSKLLLVASHYPVDDGIGTATNDQASLRNADNATSVSGILEKYDQPILFLWSHNHDLGPEVSGEILKDYGTGYQTLNTGAVGYKNTEEYVQGINMILGSDGRVVDIEMIRYDAAANASTQFTAGLEFPTVEPFTGAGSDVDPFLISSPANLRYLALMVNNGEDYKGKIFQQTEDIDLSGENWKPIGKYVSSSSPNDVRNRDFSGIYDGKGFIISGLTIDQNLVGSSIINKGYGLFGFLTGTVQNLGVTNLNIDAEISGDYNMYAGGIAGYVGYYDTEAGFIKNCYVGGTIQAAARLRSCAGGLAGYLRRGEILNSYSSVSANHVPGIDYSGAGGLIGYREIPNDGYIVNGYWDTAMTDVYGVTYNNITEGLTVEGITTDLMKVTTFIDLLNQNATSMGEDYTPWMSDALAGLNNGYPIHERVVQLVAPDIETSPVDTSALANGATAQVTLTTAVSGAEIWYTTDGSDPTVVENRTVYTTPFAISTTNPSGEAITLRAVTTDGNEIFSSISEKQILFLAASSEPEDNLTPPVIDTVPTVTSALANNTQVQVSLSSTESGISIWYTTDGTDPTNSINKIKYTTPFAVSTIKTAGETITIRAVTTNGNDNYSPIAQRQIIFQAVSGGTGGSSGGGGGGGGSTTPIPEVNPPLNPLPLPDISDITGHWARVGILRAFELGFINGYPDKTFRPNGNITRAEFLTMLVKAFNMTSTKATSWEDVDRHWARNQIQIAANNGIVEGFSSTVFGPDQVITREQLAVMLVRGIKLTPATQKSTFRDGKDISLWAVDAIDTASQWKLIQGYGDLSFRPQGPATRAEAVEMIIRALEYKESQQNSN